MNKSSTEPNFQQFLLAYKNYLNFTLTDACKTPQTCTIDCLEQRIKGMVGASISNTKLQKLQNECTKYSDFKAYENCRK